MARNTDYGFLRYSVLRDLDAGRVDRKDVCDAHPELLRAARNVSKPTGDICPVCEEGELRLVSYVYGEGLRQANGRCITTDRELFRLRRNHDEFACYVVEVCPTCGWNHLQRRYLLGRKHAV